MIADPTSNGSQGGSQVSPAVLHPLVGSALLALFVNDHWGKERWPGTATGKLSDAAGLAFFPIVLIAGLELMRWARRRSQATSRRELVIAAVVTAIAFAVVKTSTVAAARYSDVLGAMQWPVRAAAAALSGSAVPAHSPIVVRADPWDLIALPAVLVGVYAGFRTLEPADGERISEQR